MHKVLYKFRLSISITFAALSFAGCKKDDGQFDPDTTIQGRVYDIKLNTELKGVKVYLIREYGPYFFTASKIEYVDSVLTNVNGDYSIKLKPLKIATYAIYAARPSTLYYQAPLIIDFVGKKYITPGQRNICNFNFISTIELSVHIVNKSYLNRTNLKVAIDTGTVNGITVFANYFGGKTYYHFIADTLIKARVPKFSSVNAITRFTSGALGFEVKDTAGVSKNVQIGKNDTTITIVNP